MFEIFKEDKEKNELILKFKIDEDEIECPKCGSSNFRVNDYYYKPLDIGLETETKIMLANRRYRCSCFTSFSEYKIRGFNFKTKECLKSIEKILIEKDLMKV